MVSLNFTPSPDTAAILNALLDTLEQRAHRSPLLAAPSTTRGPSTAPLRGSAQDAGSESKGTRRAIRVNLAALGLPSYFSQVDPEPRQITHHQLHLTEQAGAVQLAWLPNQAGHLLETVTLNPEHAEILFTLLQRTPQAAYRARLTDLLLGERFRFKDWRLRAVQHTLAQLREEKSPAPFSLRDEDLNRDLLIALAALDEVREETPYRVFSVRVFNDSKRFDDLLNAMVILAHRHQPDWRELTNGEVLRELNLVANPNHLYLHGPWHLVDETGQMMSLAEFHPAAGLPAMQAARLKRVTVSSPEVICVENPTSFYELIRSMPHGTRNIVSSLPLAALCLWGNPSPACRHLLCCLPNEVILRVWADIDYGGLNILAQLREQVNPNAQPYRMDIETLEAHRRWARPLTPADAKNLDRLLRRPGLTDMRPLITHMLQRQLKLEQEAVRLDSSLSV